MGKKAKTVCYDTDEDDSFDAPTESFEQREEEKKKERDRKAAAAAAERERKAAAAAAERERKAAAERDRKAAAKQTAAASKSKGATNGAATTIASVVTSQPLMNAAFDGDGSGGGTSSGPPEGVRRRLALPAGFRGSVKPPIFIDNPIEAEVGQDSPFGNSMVTQHTVKRKTIGCLCCSKPFAVPDEYAVARGPAEDLSDVLATGKYNHKETCGFCGLCRIAPSWVPKLCYKDTSTFEFATQGKTFVISRDGGSGAKEIFNVKEGNIVVASAATAAMSSCDKAIKLMTTERFTEYPVELRDANGQAVLTKRTEYLGCIGICKTAASCKFVECCNSIGECGLACGIPKPCCNANCGDAACPSCCPGKPKKEKQPEKKYCGVCGPEGDLECCGCITAGEVTCFGFCGKSGPCAQKLGCILPPCCGGSCCKGGCDTVSWMEPIDLPTEQWYGLKADESGEFVATISHFMNIEFTQKYGCCRSQKVSEVYHSHVDMPARYGREYSTAEWQTVLGWLGFEWHVPINSAFYA